MSTPRVGGRYRHAKTGTVYEVLLLSRDEPDGEGEPNRVIYREVGTTGVPWSRTVAEWASVCDDGCERFVEVTPAP